jgi:hypothetical protein
LKPCRPHQYGLKIFSLLFFNLQDDDLCVFEYKPSKTRKGIPETKVVITFLGSIATKEDKIYLLLSDRANLSAAFLRGTNEMAG